MKRKIANKGQILMLAALLVITAVSLAVQTANAESEKIPIVNYFISCEEASVESAEIENGVKQVSGRYLIGEVRSTEDYHSGPATNMANATVVMETGHGTFSGKLEMQPTAWLAGGWLGTYTIEGFPGNQIGVARLRGYGDLEGYITETTVKHMSGRALHNLFPDACGGNMPVGGSQAEGYIIVPEIVQDF